MSHSLFSWFELALGFLGALGLFLVFFAVVALLVFKKKKQGQEIKIEIKNLNRKLEENKNKILSEILEKNEFKKIIKDQEKEIKLKKQKQKTENQTEKRIFVLDFQGDIAASCVNLFREQITALLQAAHAQDEIVVRLESPGGMVHAYGLAASQLARIREKGINLTVCVDKVAASGGYLMACLANKVIAAPFSIIGSIGVVANIPNLNKLLRKNDVDYLEMTAGEYKRTLSTFGEITEKGRAKFQEQLEETHLLFKDHVKKYRPILEMDSVATGEYWLGTKAFEHKLVDELGTSDDYLVGLSREFQIYHVYSPKKETLKEKLAHAFSAVTSLLVSEQIEKKNIPLVM